MVGYRIVIYTILLGGAAARAQAPAPSHASAILATPGLQGVVSGASYGLPTLESQIASSSIFGALKCRDALGAVYNAYKLSGDWSQVPQVKVKTGLLYVGCHSYTPDSVNASVILFHPTLLRGSTVTQITDKGNLLVYGSLVNIFAAAAASGPYDSELFFARYLNAVGALGSQPNFIKSSLGVYIAGSDNSSAAVCVCGFQNDPLQSNSTVQAASLGSG